MRRLAIVGWSSCLAILLTASAEPAAPVKGSYIGGDESNAYHLVLMPAGMQRIAGRLDSLSVGPEGRLRVGSARIIGEVEGDAVELILIPQDLGSLPLILSIHRATGGLTAYGEGVGSAADPLLLSAGDGAAFDAMKVRLNARSRRIQLQAAGRAPEVGSDPPTASPCGCSEEKKARAAEATRKFAAEVDLLVDGMRGVTAAAELHRRELPKLAVRYQAIAARLRDDPTADDAFNALRDGIARLATVLRETEGRLDHGLADAEVACGRRKPMPGVPMPPEARDWDFACERLADAAWRYRSEMLALRAGLRGLADVDQARWRAGHDRPLL